MILWFLIPENMITNPVLRDFHRQISNPIQIMDNQNFTG